MTDYLFIRHRHNWVQLIRFGLVGGSGVLVNLLVVIICNKVGADEHGILVDLPWSRFNVRWYHAYSTLAFLVANVWNFQLNRQWTFKSAPHSGWWREYWPFLAVGLVGQAVNLVIVTLMLNPESPLALPTSYFDSSTGFRTPLYWAQLTGIVLVTPMSFVVNKLWTFAAVRRAAWSPRRRGGGGDGPAGPLGPSAPTGPSSSVEVP
nr:GtrA family protein [Auraticoccus cholistanensis]